jgi:hypothetical protein
VHPGDLSDTYFRRRKVLGELPALESAKDFRVNPDIRIVFYCFHDGLPRPPFDSISNLLALAAPAGKRKP